MDIAVEGCINKIYTVIHEERLASLDALKEIYLLEECKKMINILRQLGHLDGDACTLKGKMASEISSGDEVLLTEMIFSTGFSELSLLDMLSLLSIVITERSKEGLDAFLSEENQKLVDGILSPSIKIVVKVMNDCGFDNVTEGSYYETNNHNFYMMDIVRMWASRYSFFDIYNSTNIYEGSIIRGFKRLEELLRQLGNAASVIGNQDLVNLFGQGIYLIKRDIVFANSLYL